MSTEFIEKGVKLDMQAALMNSPSQRMVQDLVASCLPSCEVADPLNRHAFALSFVPSPKLKLETTESNAGNDGIIGFVEIGPLFYLKDYLNPESSSNNNNKDAKSDGPQCNDKVTRLINNVFPEITPNHFKQRQLGLTNTMVPVFIHDNFLGNETMFPPRKMADALMVDFIENQNKLHSLKWNQEAENRQNLNKRLNDAAEERMKNGQDYRPLEEKVRELGTEKIREELGGVMASAFTASGQVHYGLLYAKSYMDKMKELRKELQAYESIIPEEVKKVKHIYLKNHKVYELLKSELVNSTKENYKKLSEFVNEIDSLDKIKTDIKTDIKEETLSEAIKCYFLQAAFDKTNEKVFPIDKLFENIDNLQRKTKHTNIQQIPE